MAGKVNSSSNYTGGLIGRLESSSSISKSYVAGSVIATKSSSPLVGGITSQADASSVTDSYWDTQVSGQSTSPGGGAGKTTTQMKQQATFIGWDFTGVWAINAGNYPKLR